MIKIIKKLNIFKKGPAQYRRHKSSGSGFVILYAVTLSAIILSIALGVASIALREIKFSTSAKDTNDAFFAADTGAECALVNDKTTGAIFVSPNPSPSITCNSSTITATEGPTSIWNFNISGLGLLGQGCAKVRVDKTGPTKVTSSGYNNGGGTLGFCITGLNSVERQIELNY